MFPASQTSGAEAKGLVVEAKGPVVSRAFGRHSGGPGSADGREIVAKAFGPEARPGEPAGCPTRQAFVVTLTGGFYLYDGSPCRAIQSWKYVIRGRSRGGRD